MERSDITTLERTAIPLMVGDIATKSRNSHFFTINFNPKPKLKYKWLFHTLT